NELGYIAGLLPSVDIPTDEKWYEHVSEEDLEDYLRGRISHLKNKQLKSEISWPKNSILIDELSDITISTNEHVIPLTMSDYQTSRYKDVYDHRDPFNSLALNISL